MKNFASPVLISRLVCLTLGLALSLSLSGAQAKQKPPAHSAPHAAASKAKPATEGGQVAAAPANAAPSPALDQIDNSDVLRAKKHLTRKEKKEQKQLLEEDLTTTPLLAEVLKLKWQVEPLDEAGKDVKKIGLAQVFHDTIDRSIAIRQADVQIKDAEILAKDTHDPIFNPLNPFEPGAMKQAAESNVAAAKAHRETVIQQSLLASAKAYSALTQAYLAKFLAYQAIEQGRSQLKVEQARFVSGETTRFDVTQTQMALIDRYSKYLMADNAYHAACMALANQIDASSNDIFVPEGAELQEQNQAVSLLKLLPDNLELGQVLKTAKSRPDQLEMAARKEALQKTVKASIGLDKQRRKADLHQLELEAQKLADADLVTAEKAFIDYRLAKKTLEMAQQRVDMANRYLYQLQISHTAGFSSAKELLDGQIEQSKVKTALIGAQVAYNLSQIQLLYEMGQLHETSISHPPVNAL
jgi:hypothetical protein